MSAALFVPLAPVQPTSRVRARIEPLVLRGTPTAQIVRLTGCDESYVRVIKRRMRAEGKDVPRERDATLRVHLEADVLDRLDLAAAKRGTNAAGIIQALVETVVRDNLIDGVLDE